MEPSVMEDIGRIFVRYSTKFPEEVIDLQEEIKIIQNEIEYRFQEDIGNIKRILNNKRISININFPQFENNIYLIKQALYTHTKIPDPEKCGDVLRFYTALHLQGCFADTCKICPRIYHRETSAIVSRL